MTFVIYDKLKTLAHAVSNRASNLCKRRSNSNIVGRWRYDVFLSFRGEDTRKTFAGYLYRALVDRGILTFKDDQRLQGGDSIPDQLPAAIEESRIALVVFSEHYASSSWCLDELAYINDCRKEIGLTVIPVFYNVDPYVVRRQKGGYEIFFEQHKTRHGEEKIQRWKDALFDIANHSGFPYSTTQNGDESDCIQKIVQDIWSKFTPIRSGKSNLVGIISRVKKLKLELGTKPEEVRFIGIWGMGGAGKTTLAWELYLQISNQFEGRCYVENVKELSKRSGLQSLQEKILCEVLFDKSLKVSTVNEGIGLMSLRMNRRKVLLVLDDVDDPEQLEVVAARLEWFGKGSRIIITTRDRSLLNTPTRNVELYNVTLLNNDESAQLFSLNAFGEPNPPEAYRELSRNIVHYAGGLPLVLKILGSILYDSNEDEWKSVLNRLEVAGEDKVFESLKVSFDHLSEIDQKIFLDIACFFKGEKKDYVTRILDGFGFQAHLGIKRLTQNSLIWIANERIQMHDRIQEMGWQIVRQVADEPGKHSRIWDLKEALRVLKNNKGTCVIEGISMLSPKPQEDINFGTNCFRTMNELRLLRVKVQVDIASNKFKWLYIATSKYLPKEMRYTAQLEYLPSNLQWLVWENYPSRLLPESVGEKLVGLEMHRSNIVQLWKGRKVLDKLRYIDLTDSYSLRRTPDLKLIPNLHTLILESCRSLQEVLPSVGYHEKLVLLNLKGCFEVQSLTSSIEMKSLESLDLSWCQCLQRCPDMTGNMERLSSIDLSNTPIQELPASIGKLSGLVSIKLSVCHRLISLPSTICKLKFLKTLDVSHCIRLTALPENLGQIENLEELFLDFTPIEKLPSSMVHPKNLKTISLRGCAKLVSSMLSCVDSSKIGLEVPHLLTFGSIKRLILYGCKLSEREIPTDLSTISSLEELDLSDNHFSYLPTSICQLPRLKILNVSSCQNLDALQALPSGIAMLWADDTRTWTSFPDLSTKYKSLWKISLCTKCDLGEPADLVLKSLLQGHLATNHLLSIVVDGRNIPKWFNKQSVGRRTYAHLPSKWYEKDLLGFAICASIGTLANFLKGYIDIEFDLIQKGDFQSFTEETLDPDFHYQDYKPLWLGFMSFDFFQLLFPDYSKPNDWTRFEGFIGVQFGRTRVDEWRMCAIRPVYKEDVEKVPPRVQKSALIQNDGSHQPWLEYYDPNVDKLNHETSPGQLFSSATTYLTETRYRHARFSFSI